MGFVRKSVSITQEQAAFLKEANLSLSRVIQQKLTEEYTAWKRARRAEKILREMEQGKYEEMSMDRFLQEARKW